MKKLIMVSLVMIGVVGCAGTPSNSYTPATAANVSSWELCRNIGYHEFFNRDRQAKELAIYVAKRGDIDAEACRAIAEKGKEYAERQYRRSMGY